MASIGPVYRLAAEAIAAKALSMPTPARNSGAIQSAQGTVGEQLQGATRPSLASRRRDMWIVRLLTADRVFHLVLFAALTGLPPNPINGLVQDWFLARSSPRGGFGTIDTDTIFWFALVGVLVLFFGLLGVALLLRGGWRLICGQDDI